MLGEQRLPPTPTTIENLALVSRNFDSKNDNQTRRDGKLWYNYYDHPNHTKETC